MEEIRVTLENGYTLVASKEDTDTSKIIHVSTEDSEGVWNQEIVSVITDNAKKGEEFKIYVYANPISGVHDAEHFVNCFHDKGVEEDDADEDSSEVEEIQKADVLTYGTHGDEVKKIQTRLKELGYFDGVIGGNYLSKTSAAIEAFQTANGLHVNGACFDEITREKLFDDNAIKAEKNEAVSVNGNQEYAKEMDWWKSNIQQIFSKGTDALITDVETGLKWYERRRGGTNHADVQPLTKQDTANLKKAYGGKWSWDRRAIWVTINGITYAASMNGMPHGGSSIKDNGFDGHHCVHFTNSRTHCSNKVCPNHQKAIKKAATTKINVQVW